MAGLGAGHRAGLARFIELDEIEVIDDPTSSRARWRITHEEVNDDRSHRPARFVTLNRQKRTLDGWETVVSLRIPEPAVGKIAECLTWAAEQV